MDTENLSPVDGSTSSTAAASLTESAAADSLPNAAAEAATTIAPGEPKPSYVKLAMRNMVRKRGKSLQHFFLTTAALLGLLVGLSYLTR
ncbi:MAG: DUF3285 domain-containing protein [Leptolyngbyaceae cyanobacterium bins.349]|nr:DUF3285 domain-containing protein [Leptolyngbyaceae cyanobacterium bins.349]